MMVNLTNVPSYRWTTEYEICVHKRAMNTNHEGIGHNKSFTKFKKVPFMRIKVVHKHENNTATYLMPSSHDCIYLCQCTTTCGNG